LDRVRFFAFSCRLKPVKWEGQVISAVFVGVRVMAKTGAGGFGVVASGISESLIATAAGIVVAVVAVMAYNAFQTQWSGLVLLIKIQTEELTELLGKSDHGD
jgi:biopolymer transport protein ExbB/TolQ